MILLAKQLLVTPVVLILQELPKQQKMLQRMHTGVPNEEPVVTGRDAADCQMPICTTQKFSLELYDTFNRMSALQIPAYG